MRKRKVVGLGTAALTMVAALKVRRVLQTGRAETGEFDNGMRYARWGDGPKNLLWIPGGPGSDVPHGSMSAIYGRQFKPLTDAGFAVWQVARRANMPAGHSVSDMADDYAQLIADRFGGHVDAVVGISYGGMIAQYLAADHASCFDHLVIALSADQITDWGRDVDYRWAQARAQGRDSDAGLIMAEYIYPDDAAQRQRRRVAPLLSRVTSGEHVLAGDLMVEAEAELAFDAREALPRITVPVLLISAEGDMFFTPEIVAETVGRISDCTHIEYEGIGHMRAAMSSGLVRDVLDWVERPTAGA
ncbi:MAG: alpha/beta hydrolase [Candidatus Nanopelagicales bacterium]